MLLKLTHRIHSAQTGILSPVPKLFCGKSASYFSCEEDKKKMSQRTSDKVFVEKYVREPAPMCVIVSLNLPTSFRFGGTLKQAM